MFALNSLHRDRLSASLQHFRVFLFLDYAHAFNFFLFIQLICNRYNTHLPIIETVEEKAIIDEIVSNHESMCPKYLLILFISLPFNFTSLYSIFLSVVV